MYAKMLKETEDKETKLFWQQIFVIGGILIEGARVPSATPGYANDFEMRSLP